MVGRLCSVRHRVNLASKYLKAAAPTQLGDWRRGGDRDDWRWRDPDDRHWHCGDGDHDRDDRGRHHDRDHDRH
jgi:hypothetical protein